MQQVLQSKHQNKLLVLFHSKSTEPHYYFKLIWQCYGRVSNAVRETTAISLTKSNILLTHPSSPTSSSCRLCGSIITSHYLVFGVWWTSVLYSLTHTHSISNMWISMPIFTNNNNHSSPGSDVSELTLWWSKVTWKWNPVLGVLLQSRTQDFHGVVLAAGSLFCIIPCQRSLCQAVQQFLLFYPGPHQASVVVDVIFKVKPDNFFVLTFSLWCTTWLNCVIVVEKWHHSLLNLSPISPVLTRVFSLPPDEKN